MKGILIRQELEDNGIRAKLKALVDLGKNPEDALRDIATYGESTTRERFSLQLDPDGNRWKPSLRVQLHGGKTLTRDGHLGDSITSRSGKTFAEWGSNQVHAAPHQFGAVIKPKAGGTLRFMLANGAWISTKQVTLPKREFLGVNEENAADILDMLQVRVEGAH